MEEKIPQLTLTPDLGKEPVLEPVKEEDLIEKAEKAPEAGPDLSMLSAAEQQAVLAFSEQIDLTDSSQVLQYGAAAQKNIADFSGAALGKVRTKDMGEGGDMLSTGEKQLLSFARAILADPRILVLDEATASVDTITEQKIQSAIDTIIHGRTSIVIAHRLSTVRNADLILVVDDGKIIEQGTHEQLMSRRGSYYRLYTRQYEDEATSRLLS